MAGKIGQITGQEVKTYKGVDNIRVLQVALFGANPESVVYMNTSGEDTAPVNGDMVIVRELGADKYTFGVRDPVLLVSEPGEKRIYSYDENGVILASVYLTKDGKFIAEKPAANIIFDVFEHQHIDNWGKLTTAPVNQGTPVPTPPATIVVESDLDLDTNSKTIDGVDVKNHGHDYTWTSGAGSGTTDPP